MNNLDIEHEIVVTEGNTDVFHEVTIDPVLFSAAMSKVSVEK